MKNFSILICAALIASAIGQTSEAKWPEAMFDAYARRKQKNDAGSRASKKGKTNSKKGKAGQASGQNALGSFADPYPGTSEEAARLNAYHLARVEARMTAENLILEGRWSEALTGLEGFLNLYPDEESIVPTLADACFRIGLNQRAYDALAPFARTGAMPETLVRASLAASRRGEVYPGQRDYCIAYLPGGSRPQLRSAVLMSSVPSGQRPRDLEVLSLLVLGTGKGLNAGEHRPAAFYLSEVLRLDPSNPLANSELGDVHLRSHRYAQAVVCYERAVARARSPMLEAIRRQLETARYLRDH